MDQIRTVCDIFFHNVEDLPREDLLLAKRGGVWRSWSSAEVSEGVRALAYGLMGLGVKPGDKVVLISEDRPEWLMADYAILTSGAVTVPLYPTLNAQETAYIVNDCDAEVAIVSTTDHADKLVAQRGSLPRLRDIVIMDVPQGGPGSMLSWEDLLRRGWKQREEDPDSHRRRADAVVAEDLATIIYTSGTTGVPKGVMLTHRNFVENVRAGIVRLIIGPADRALVFLPLSHSFERMLDYAYFWRGLSIAYAEGIDKVADNMGEVQPTIMAAVPRFYEKVYAKVLDQAAHASFLKKLLVHWSINTTTEWAERKAAGRFVGPWLGLRYALARQLVPKKLIARTGGRLRFFVSGGAPLPRHLAVFFWGAGLKICEGYGLSETTPVVTVNAEESVRFGSPGRPLDNVEVRFGEDGEIFVRGPNVMKGYYKKPEATAEVLGPDGWFATGDIGHADADGFLYITDRKKEIIVTAGGKNVAPQPIENLVKTNKYVSQVVLIGDRRPYITALIVPNWGNVLDYAKSKGVSETDPVVLSENHQVFHLFQHVLERANAELSRYEQIKRCKLLPRELTQEDGELTPTLKVKRRVINQRYAQQIEELYAAAGSGTAGSAD
jgi:long-chain acyl-CoA synthetase